MRQNVKARMAQCSGSELSQALTHTHARSLQYEHCFMEDIIPGVINEREVDLLANEGQTLIPPVRMASSLLEPKNTQMHLLEYPNPPPPEKG